MAAPSTGVCAPWAVAADVTTGPCSTAEAPAGFTTPMLDAGLQVASDVLFNLTGRAWPGVCSATVRPCMDRPAVPWTVRGAALSGCGNSGRCACGGLSEILLPGRPIVSITKVKIDGVVISSLRYRVDDFRYLVYLPESDSAERQGWPCSQRLDLADTEPDTWSVAYTFGSAPPYGGVMAAKALGCELALAMSPETVGMCRLPKRITSITRQGVSLAILDPLTLFADGLTGLPEVDLWVSSIRVGRARRPSGVVVPGSPGRGRVRRVATWQSQTEGGLMAQTGTFDVTPTAVQIPSSSVINPRSATVINRGTATVWFGFTQVAAEARTGVGDGKGIRLEPGDRMVADLLPGDQLWVSCASGTQRVEVIQTDARTFTQ